MTKPKNDKPKTLDERLAAAANNMSKRPLT